MSINELEKTLRYLEAFVIKERGKELLNTEIVRKAFLGM